LRAIRAAFPDVTIEADEIIADDHGVAFRSTFRGTHLGEFLGIPPTGKAIEVGLVDFIRIEEGRFVAQWGGPDLFDLVKQLGATFTTGQ
jgi:predicted ester cyclase